MDIRNAFFLFFFCIYASMDVKTRKMKSEKILAAFIHKYDNIIFLFFLYRVLNMTFEPSSKVEDTSKKIEIDFYGIFKYK